MARPDRGGGADPARGRRSAARTPGGRGGGTRPPAGPGARRGEAPAVRPRAAASGGHAGRRTTLTSRAAVLALVVCALVVMLADPLQQYLGQRSQLTKQRAANAALQHRVDALSAQQRLWSDPSYVKQQARERLYFVMPGETAYVVVGGTRKPHQPAGSTAVAGGAAPVSVSPGSTWYTRLWSSVRGAGATSPGAGG